MNYRNELSILGFGCMRFARKGAGIDITEIEKEIMTAIENGINYFDTAYVYPGSEEALGKVLQKNNCRDKIKIATKLPHYLIRSEKDIDKCFSTQLKRLKTDHVDYYLMHMLPDVNVWDRLTNIGIKRWIESMKSSGKIAKIGFSYHGSTPGFKELLDVYPWDFCQIQYNYMDEHSQAGRSGLIYAHEKNIPVIIMEPLRGGSLVKDLPPEAHKLFDSAQPERSPAEWALRWLWDQPEVSCVLSGMNSMEMLEENIRIASSVEPDRFTPEDQRLITDVKAVINAKVKIPCTGCSYCMPCPFGVDIPGSFRCYNVSHTHKYFSGFREYLMCTTFRAKRSNASLCRKCGKCEPHCPQEIQIRDELHRVSRRFENPIYKIIALVCRRLFR